MTHAECEIVANAGVQLREIAERLTLPASFSAHTDSATARAQVMGLCQRMDSAALSISEVYGQLSALPLEVEE